jgi:mono/diheme cytochrome c family protein
MLNCEEQKAVGSRQKAGNLSALAEAAHCRQIFLCLLLSALCLLAAGCRRDMQDQPKAKSYRENSFYKDGSASRPLVEGTVPRGYLKEDRAFFFGKKLTVAELSTEQSAARQTSTLYPDDVDTFPIAITKEALDRGQERYNIYCSVCHGMTGYGDGIVARRGFNRPSPASYHQDRLRQAPVGHFFDVMTNGWGAMPSYASQIPVEDRWKIIAYIRALQLSQLKSGATSVSEQGNNSAVREGAAQHR